MYRTNNDLRPPDHIISAEKHGSGRMLLTAGTVKLVQVDLTSPGRFKFQMKPQLKFGFNLVFYNCLL